MNILWLQWRDIRHPWAGGAEVYMHEICRRLVLEGHEVLALTSGFKGLPESEVVDGYRVERVGDHDLYLLGLHGVLGRYARWADVVVEDTSKVPLYTPIRLRGKPIVAVVHHLNRGIYFEELPLSRALLAYAMEGLFPRLYASLPNVRLVAVSESTYKELVGLGARPDRVAIVADAIDHERYRPRMGSNTIQKSPVPTLLYLSRLKRYKRPHHAVLAFKRVAHEMPDAKLIIAGDGELKPELRCLIKKLGLEERVEVRGRVSEVEKLRLLQESWVLVQTSRKEGFGLTVLEANACGTPAVGYDVPGLRDSIRHGETGILVPSGDVEALAEAVATLLTDDGFREKLSKNALEWSRQFSWDRSAEEFKELLKGVIDS